MGVSKETKKSKRSKYNRSKSELQTQANRISSTSILSTAKNTQARPKVSYTGTPLYDKLQTSLQLMLVEKGGTQKTQRSFLNMSEN